MRKHLTFVICMLCFPPAIALGQGIEHLHDDYYSYKGLVVTLDVDDLHPFGFGGFIVMTDSTLGYYSEIDKGIFVASTYDGGDLPRFEIEKITFDGETRARTLMNLENKKALFEFVSGSSFYHEGFWSNKIQGACVCFNVFEIDFIFREYKQMTFEAANAHAQDEDEALIEYTTTVFFITKVLSLKRVNVGRTEIPRPDKGSAFRSYKDGNRYREATGCPPVKIKEDTDRNE